MKKTALYFLVFWGLCSSIHAMNPPLWVFIKNETKHDVTMYCYESGEFPNCLKPREKLAITLPSFEHDLEIFIDVEGQVLQTIIPPKTITKQGDYQISVQDLVLILRSGENVALSFSLEEYDGEFEIIDLSEDSLDDLGSQSEEEELDSEEGDENRVANY